MANVMKRSNKNSNDKQSPKNNSQKPPNQTPSSKSSSLSGNPSPNSKLVPILIYNNTDQNSKTPLKLMIDPSKHTLGTIKSLLEKKTGIPVPRQFISLRYLGTELSLDEKPAAFYGIKCETELELDSWWAVTAEIISTGKSHQLKVRPTKDTCDSIKLKLANLEPSLPVQKQILLFQGQELPKRPIKQVEGLGDGSTIQVEVNTKTYITVLVVLESNRKIPLEVDTENDSLHDIKEKLVKKTRLPTDNQRLYFQKRELMYDTPTLYDYGIEDGAILEVEPKVINVTVDLISRGKTFIVTIDLLSDMSELLERVMAMMENNPEVDKRTINYGDSLLDRKGKVLKDLGFRDGSKIQLDSTTSTLTTAVSR